ncbi:hypothetical protein [Brevundimonas sp. Root1423]|uniref:hypothetical protein n=1 Tax=Brevundimonas sp. Root1423 TaxID=1736462 RepID=UPI000ABAA1AC|nr:hypothetical protein [Brevundimonas sp. Root1423]
MRRIALAAFALATGMLLASCGEPRNEVSVKVETEDGRSAEVREEVSPEQAAAVKDQLREKTGQ